MSQKVLHLLQSSHYSGAENVACQIINMLRGEQFEIAYCSRDGRIRAALQAFDITFFPIEEFSLKEVKRVVREFKPDIIHTHDVRAAVAAALVGGRAVIISHMHVNDEIMNQINIKTLLYLACSLRFKHIFWVSNSCFDNYVFKKYLSAKSSILFNIVDQQEIYEKMKLDNTAYNYDIVFIGRVTYQKNPERLVHVLNQVMGKKPDAKAAIVGDGVLLDDAKRLSAELGLDQYISFLGFQANPLKILYNSKVMLMTSRYEGTPICALEAMALGVPIVSTPTDGLLDLIEEGETGYISDNDTVLADRIIAIISNPEKHSQLSRNTITRFKLLNDRAAYKHELENAYAMS